MNFDLGIHAQAIKMRAQRSEVLATNIANAETPNYKARDFDFNQALQSAVDQRSVMKATHANHIQGGEADLGGHDLMYRVPTQPSIDGNTVDIQEERAEFTRNAMQYQASIQFLNGKVSGIMKALKGGQ